MDIATSLRRENIAEYILYLWQLEDLLRSLQFSPQAIYSQFVATRKELSADEQSALLEWYVDLCNILEREGKRSSGHSEHTIHLIADLNDLHLRILNLPIGARYRVVWAALEEVLADLRAKSSYDVTQVSDIELCFRALYAAVLYKLKGQEGRGAVEDTLAYISPAIGELSRIYGAVERGEADLFATK